MGREGFGRVPRLGYGGSSFWCQYPTTNKESQPQNNPKLFLYLWKTFFFGVILKGLLINGFRENWSISMGTFIWQMPQILLLVPTSSK